MKIFTLSIICIFTLTGCIQKNSIPSAIQNNKAGVNTFSFKYKDFETFYDKFINDTVFQLSRIKFPIKGNYADYAGECNWTKDKWPAIKWDLRKEIKNTSDSVFIEQTDSMFFFGEYCRDCGFSFEMAFKRFKGEWYLTLCQENNY